MSLQAILLPVFAEIALTFALLLWLSTLRTRALGKHEVEAGDIALGQMNWPERILKVGNSFQNQLELPVLFYALVILAIIARKADLLFVILSWVFVASRFVHALVHTGANAVRLRGAAFGIGLIILIVMWIIFAVRVLAS
jgi:hypothetical protein